MTTANPKKEQEFTASVRVMRSYDYCHFEISLGSENLTLEQVNDLRKKAALLVDEAVRQYIIAKGKEDARRLTHGDIERALRRIELIKEQPKNEWSIEDAALMRSYEDKEFWKLYEVDEYFYEDEPEREHHFSMLRKFQDVSVKVTNQQQ
jgi:tryptophan 2,3-dioxygenase